MMSSGRLVNSARSTRAAAEQVAAYIANLNVDTIDMGVPVLSMHAPFEIVSKLDTYMAYKAFSVFMVD